MNCRAILSRPYGTSCPGNVLPRYSQSSLRDFIHWGMHPVPAMYCRAILSRPYGTSSIVGCILSRQCIAALFSIVPTGLHPLGDESCPRQCIAALFSVVPTGLKIQSRTATEIPPRSAEQLVPPSAVGMLALGTPDIGKQRTGPGVLLKPVLVISPDTRKNSPQTIICRI